MDEKLSIIIKKWPMLLKIISPASEAGTAWIGLYCMAVVLGFGRFLFTATLPDIMAQINIDTPTAGWLASINYMGYFLGAVIAMFVSQRLTWQMLMMASVLSVVTTAALSVPQLPLVMWNIIRLLAGVASGIGMTLGSSLVVKRFTPKRRALLSTIHYSGIGVGITASALLTWWLLSQGQHFKMIWLAAAIISLPLLILLIKIRPTTQIVAQAKSVNGSSLNGTSVLFSAVNLSAKNGFGRNGLNRTLRLLQRAIDSQGKIIVLLLFSYALSGFGYITSATFLPVMASEYAATIGVSDGLAGLNGQFFGLLIWLVVGIFVTVCNPLWGQVAYHIGESKTLMGLITFQALGMFLPVWCTGMLGLLGNAVILGATFVGIVSMTLGMIKEINPKYSNFLIGLATLAYAVGQFLGPLVTVALAQGLGGFDAGLITAGVGLLIGLGLIIAAQKSR